MVARIGRKIPVIFNSARHVKHATDSMILHKRHSRILPLPEAHKKQYNVHCNVQSIDISQDEAEVPCLDGFKSECTQN
jgi:hypothetical protein